MKNCLIILISFLFLNCSNNAKLEGFWYGKRDGNTSPLILKFENNRLINYSSVFDTLKYRTRGDKLFIKNKFNEESNVKFRLDNSELTIINSTTDTIISEFKRKESDCFFIDILNDKSLRFDLPFGNGLERKYSEINRFEPLYVTYKNDKLIANFRNKTNSVDKNFYKLLLKTVKYKSYEKYYVKISFIADKNIKIQDFELIKKQLKLANYNKIELILKNDKYDFINSFQLRLPPLLDKDLKEYGIETKEYILPPAPAKFDKNHSLLIEIGNNNIKINNVAINKIELKKKIQEKLTTDSKFNISYTFTDNAVYQDYINTLDIVYNSIIDLRKTYLKNKYNIEYYSTDYDDREKIKESKEKFRFVFFNIDNAEY
jgi:biopolymer transport protein ExbD